jgi:oxygen-independent coproporphyrinogen-3 oxidase
MKQNPHNIYIHVPFCKSKCKYCAFFSQQCAEPDWEKYTKNICEEIIFWGQKLGKINIPTIFFGGGTPSLVPQRYIEQILQTIHNNFSIQDNIEITLESNPATINKTKLSDLQQMGINRLSVGVQRLNDEELNFLGRIHSTQDAVVLINDAKSLGLRVSADFIYGIPNDTPQKISNICTQINSLELMHCSLYELTIEQNTPFGKMNLNMPNNDDMAIMYQTIAEKLTLPRYEVSNYAQNGNECQHNQNVWDGEPYIGIGQGAAGRILIDNIWFEQLGNNEMLKTLSDKERAIEKILTGMRTIRGCQLTQDVKNVIDINWVTNHPEYVKVSDNRIAATKQGMLILDNIITNVVK